MARRIPSKIVRQGLLASAIVAIFLCGPVDSVSTVPGTPALAAEQRYPAAQTIDGFFRDFTADWIRNDPNLARRTRYFSGDEQDRLERQLTPRTRAFREARIARAKRGLAELKAYNRAQMSESERVSADLMQ